MNVAKIVEDSGDAFEVLYKNGQRVRIEIFGRAAWYEAVYGTEEPDIII